MAGMLERDEWRAFSDAMALVAAGVLSLVGLILAVAGKDAVMAFHGCVLLGAAGLAFLYILTQMIERAEPRAEAGYADGVIRAGVIATVLWGLAGFLVGDLIWFALAATTLHAGSSRAPPCTASSPSRRSISICPGPVSAG